MSLKILGSRRIIKVGADVAGDIRSLHALRQFTADGFIDLQHEAPHWGIEEKSLRKLSAIVLNERVSKAQRLSNWEAGTLTEQQQEYAATDAWICLKIFDRLLREAPEGYKPTIISAQPTEQSAEHGAHRKHHYRRNKSKNSEQ